MKVYGLARTFASPARVGGGRAMIRIAILQAAYDAIAAALALGTVACAP
jgi:hypothetical protein